MSSMRRTILLLVVSALLVGCSARANLTQLPDAVTFTPITEATDFNIDAELVLQPHPELPNSWQGSMTFRFVSLVDEDLHNVRVAIFYPEQMVEMLLIPEETLVLPPSGRRFDVTPERPEWRFTHTVAAFDWEQLGEVKAAILNPIRLRIVWDGAERFLEIPPSEIAVREQTGERLIRKPPEGV